MTSIIAVIDFTHLSFLESRFLLAFCLNKINVKRKNIILLSLSVIAIAAGLYFYLLKDKGKVILWNTSPVEKGDISTIVTATGSINALTTVQVGAQVNGTIAKLFADFNSVVKKGQIVALLDTTFLAASRDDAIAAAEKAKIQLHQAQTEFERITSLYNQNAVAQADYDLAKTNYESAKSILKSADAQLNRAKINLLYATIRAPISGTVISRNVDVGQTVISSFSTPTLFTIANDLTKMQVYANIDEADIGQIRVGQNARFTVDAYPNEIFEGRIKQIRLQPNIIQNVVNYTVVIDVPNPDLKLLPGLTANIIVKVQEHDNILKIHTGALRFVPPSVYLEKTVIPDSLKQRWQNGNMSNIIAGDTTYLWLKKDKTISPQKVVVGLSEGGYTEIAGDIKEGDEVITGINKEGDNTSATKNPFMPKFPASRKR